MGRDVRLHCQPEQIITVIRLPKKHDDKRSTCSTWLGRGRTPRGPRGNLTISWDNTTSTIRGNYSCSAAVHALFERCRRPA